MTDDEAIVDKQVSATGNEGGKYSQDPVVRNAEEPFIELSKDIQGFAGFHLTREGNLVARVKNVEDNTSVKQTVLSYVSNRYQHSDMSFSTGQITVKNAKYSYQQLSNWRDILIRPVFSIKGVTMFDLAEAKNRLEK